MIIKFRPDPILSLTLLGLTLIGMIMVSSTSLEISLKLYGNPFHQITRQFIHLALGLFFAVLAFQISLEDWQKNAQTILLFCLILLVILFIPGLGHTANGSTRWLKLGFFKLQVSELVKLGVIIYVARFLVVYRDDVTSQWSGFIKPLIIVGIVSFLLLLEPDLGAAFVILSTTLLLLFLGGTPIRYFLLSLVGSGVMVSLVIMMAPYRMARLTAFLDPWANPYGSGYQLTQSLIAFGRGGFWGNGLGNSMQKQFYLPEAHTDFIFAVISEEMGLVGAMVVLCLYGLFFFRGMSLAHQAHLARKHFAGYLAQGIVLFLTIQMVISLGVNTGLLPTKGLALPFISYGGSSLIIYFVAVAVLFRVQYENQYH